MILTKNRIRVTKSFVSRVDVAMTITHLIAMNIHGFKLIKSF